MKRVVPSIVIGVAALSVLIDPYTFYETASDDRIVAPWWQTAIAFTDLAVLAVAVVFVWRGAAYRGLLALGLEAVLNIGITAIQVGMHGVSRFLVGAGSQEYLSWYLAVVAVRVVGLVALAAAPQRAKESGVQLPGAFR
jgi:hypothetical protein